MVITAVLITSYTDHHTANGIYSTTILAKYCTRKYTLTALQVMDETSDLTARNGVWLVGGAHAERWE